MAVVEDSMRAGVWCAAFCVLLFNRSAVTVQPTSLAWYPRNGAERQREHERLAIEASGAGLTARPP